MRARPSSPALSGADAAPDGRPSKSQRKRDMHELQALGEQLAALPDDRLAAAEMPDALRAAIDEYRRTRSHEGRRRQLQYIGKLMRQADVEPLREAVAAAQIGSARETLALHEAERWRAELVADDAALERWAQRFPGADLQQLRSLVRAARADAALAPGQRHGRPWRALYQFVKPHVAEATDAAVHSHE
ncbi:MAG: ribosome biogenesis factor YjgA [Burkholderiaceae bacterium]